MTILDLLKESVARLERNDDVDYVSGVLLPEMIGLLEKGYPVFQSVEALAAKYPDFAEVKDLPDYHDIDNVFGDVVGIDEMVDVTVKREHMPLAWRKAEVDLGRFDADFKAWHGEFLRGLASRSINNQ